MQLIIHCAMPEESKIFADWLNIDSSKIKEHTAIEAPDKKVILWTTGIGSNNVITGYRELMEVLMPKEGEEYYMINVGYCGAYKAEIGDMVQAVKSYNFDFKLPDRPYYDIPNENITAVLVRVNNIPEKICYSSNHFVELKDISDSIEDLDSSIFDMELKTLTDLCKVFMFPLTSIKIVTDNLDYSEYTDKEKQDKVQNAHKFVLSAVKLMYEETKDIIRKAPKPNEEV